MCTLTVVPLPDNRVRLAFNRDEQRSRPPALPPNRKRFGQREALLPTDPVSGGTWLAVNDAGVTLAILNATADAGSAAVAPRRSRGEIIPSLLGCRCLATALEAFERLVHYPEFAPFRLVLVGRRAAVEVHWDGRQPMVTNRLIGAPLLFTSSGLGDQVVEGPRRAFFEAYFAGPADGWEAAQDGFHRHRWQGRGHLSVNMSRADARTVSFTVVELRETEAVLTYHAGAPDEAAESSTHHLPFTPGGAL